MIRKILAVIAAAACAGLIVAGFTPKPAPAGSGGISLVIQSNGTDISNSSKTAEVMAWQRVAGIRNAVCGQSWPYYEQSCLHDGTASGGKPRVVRVVTADRAVTGPISQTQH